MGLYDNVKCDYKLHGAPREIQNDTFQTKDLECLMEYYIITEDGELIYYVYEYCEVPEEERPYYGTPEWDKEPFRKMIGAIKSKFVEYRKIDYHGIINIYTIANDKMWWEYKIKFTDGKVTGVERREEINYED